MYTQLTLPFTAEIQSEIDTQDEVRNLWELAEEDRAIEVAGEVYFHPPF